MSDERRLVISTDPSLTPDDISRRTFGTAFRGWDPNEVKAYLAKVGKELSAAQQRVRQLEREIREVSSRAQHPELDEATITSALGEEAARILRTAREAAADIKGRAEENAERAIRQGQDEAKRIRSEAEAVLADRLKEAEEAAEVLRQAAEADGQRILEDAKAHSREMVHEAQGLRAKVLGDLARRRKLAQVQVAQLRAGRERLLDAYRTVRRTLDEVSDELQRADAEARLAAEQAAIRASDLPEASVDELAANLTTAVPASLQETPEEAQPEPEPEAEPAPAAPTVDAPKPEVAAQVAPAAAAPAPPRHMTKAQKKAERRAEREREAQKQAEGAKAGHAPAAPAATSKPTPPPKPAPPPAPAPDIEVERTSSSLRVLRGPKPAPPTVTTSSGAELEVVEASADIETVRVIPASASPEPAVPDSGVPEAAEIAPAQKPESEPKPEVAEAPEPEPEPEPEPAREPEAAEESEPEPEAEPEPEPEAAENANEKAPDAPAEPAAESQPVDDLFARIRADRAAAVERAQQVLQEATAPADAPKAPEAPERQSAVASIDDGHIRRRDGELQPIEATLARRLKRGLQDDQNELLDRLRSHRGPITIETLLTGVDEHAERFKQVGRDLLAQAARAGAAFAGAPATPTPDLADLIDALAGAVVGPLRGRLERGLSGALAEGDDESVLVERVGAAYREWKSQRIEQLATDQVLAAFGRGLMASTEEGTPLRWIVRDVGGPCPDCDDNALAGALPSGETWPTGQVHPPAHPGCRCLLVPAPH